MLPMLAKTKVRTGLGRPMLAAVRLARRCGDCAVVAAPPWHNLRLAARAGRIWRGAWWFGNVESPAGIVLALLTRCRELACNPPTVGGGHPDMQEAAGKKRPA